MKILYIAGCGRSGSTILQNILGEVPRFFAAGEICSLGNRYTARNPCGCAESLNHCPFWMRTLVRAFEHFDSAQAQRLQQLLRPLRTRHFPLLLTEKAREQLCFQNVASRNLMERLYRAIGREAGATVIIDSSKDPLYGFLLSRIKAFDVYFVHLVRDPRAVAFSNQRKRPLRPQNGAVDQSRVGSLQSSLLWDAWNLAAATLLRHAGAAYRTVRYEDLVRDPPQIAGQILQWLHEPEVGLPFVSPHSVWLGPNHTVGGNPARFRTGIVELRPDEEWKTAMFGSHYGLVTALTWPVARRFGYWPLSER